MTDVLYFPEDNPKVQTIYDKYKIERCLLYQNLTDTDSTSLFFVFICNLYCQLNEKIQEMHRTDKYSQLSSVIWSVWPNG